MRVALYVAFVSFYSAFLFSAKAEIRLTVENDTAFISITGDIVEGDGERFFKILKGSQAVAENGFLILNSRGGNVTEAISIGLHTFSAKYSTVVLDNADCQSACALIWLAGKTRIATPSSRIGFHQSYTLDTTGKATPSIQGNALVGYFLGQINQTPQVVAYVTNAGPDSLEWLSFSKAKELGIEVVAWKDDRETTMGRLSDPIEQKPATTNQNDTIAHVPKIEKDAGPSNRNLKRVAKNVLAQYRKHGLLGLIRSSKACWKRAIELSTAKSFQYCFALDAISSYIDNQVSGENNQIAYFKTDNVVNRHDQGLGYVNDNYRFENGYVEVWLKTSLSEFRKLIAEN